MQFLRTPIFSCGLVLLGVMSFVLLPLIHAQVGRNLPFQSGELLQYSISLLGIPAGTATMTVEPLARDHDQPRLRLVTTAKSNDFVSFFFPVNNLVDSQVKADTMLPEHLIFHRREGNRHEDFDVTFDHQARRVSILKGDTVQTLDIPPLTHDPLSCLYFLRRSSELDPGMSIFFTIHHDQKNYDVEVQVEKIETISGPWGREKVTRLLILMPFRGIFLNEGNIRVWVTNDRDRVPLKMQARMVIGSIEAMLESPLRR